MNTTIGTSDGPPDGFITTKEAASFTTLAVGSLANLRVQGLGPKFYKIGKRVVYRRDELAEWVANGSSDQ